MSDGREEGPDRAPFPAEMGRFLGQGLAWALSTLLFLFLGWAVDEWLGTLPVFTIVGVLVGAGAGFYHLYYRVIVQPRERDERDG